MGRVCIDPSFQLDQSLLYIYGLLVNLKSEAERSGLKWSGSTGCWTSRTVFCAVLLIWFEPFLWSFHLKLRVAEVCVWLVKYCPLVAPTGHCSHRHHNDMMCCLCSPNILFYLIVCSPVSQSDTWIPDSVRFNAGEVWFGGGVCWAETSLVSHKRVWICGWIYGPCISLRSHHTKYPVPKQERDRLRLSSYAVSSNHVVILTSHKFPPLLFLCPDF